MKGVENHFLLARGHQLVPRMSHPETEMKRMQAVRETRSVQQSGVQRKLCINYRILKDATITLECIYSRMTVRRNCIDALTWILAALSSRVLFINHAASPFPYLRSRLHVKSVRPIISFRRNYVSLPARTRRRIVVTSIPTLKILRTFKSYLKIEKGRSRSQIY